MRLKAGDPRRPCRAGHHAVFLQETLSGEQLLIGDADHPTSAAVEDIEALLPVQGRPIHQGLANWRSRYTSEVQRGVQPSGPTRKDRVAVLGRDPHHGGRHGHGGESRTDGGDGGAVPQRNPYDKRTCPERADDLVGGPDSD